MGLDDAAPVRGGAKPAGLLRKSHFAGCAAGSGHQAEVSEGPACGQRGSWDRNAGQETEWTSFGSACS